MELMSLHGFHETLGAVFGCVNGAEMVAHYGRSEAEHLALHQSAGVLDLSFRGRLCLTGADRVRFLHGQVTNDIKRLRSGEGCYAALVTPKGKIESDLFVYNLPDELLLDFEPGLAQRLSQRLEKYIVADDVQVVDVAPHYGLLSVQGPRASAVVAQAGLSAEISAPRGAFVRCADAALGEIYLVNQPRLGTSGFDLFVPAPALRALADRLVAAVRGQAGSVCGWDALEVARIEAGLPRFGQDMTENNLPQECGIEERAVSYTKGCYIGQEVLNRLHTMGHVNRSLCGLRLPGNAATLPPSGEKLFFRGKEAGYLTSAASSPCVGGNIGLGYLRQEASQEGSDLNLGAADGQAGVTVVRLPFC